mmetsp:Transcript_2673/g.8927  ORF Transcript_2673/g.8927 Transcript_2673/m.8927 type:complete len:425 (-) Transcript_2673:125-1399(-)
MRRPRRPTARTIADRCPRRDRRGQRLRRHRRVVVEDAVEGAVQAVVDVEHLPRASFGGGVGHPLLANHRRGERVRLGGQETAWLGEQAHAARGREGGVEGRAQRRRDGGEGELRAVDAREASAQVEQVHPAARRLGEREDVGSSLHGGDVRLRRVAARADVEGDAAHAQAQLGGAPQQRGCLGERGAVLVAHHAHGLGVVHLNAQQQLRARRLRRRLEQLRLRVKDREADAGGGGEAEVGGLLARVGVHDAVRRHAGLEDEAHLRARGAVEAAAERAQQREDLGVRVALDGVERVDARKLAPPESDSRPDGGEVDEVKGLLGAGGDVRRKRPEHVRRERRPRGRVEAVLEAVWEAALEEGLARHLRRRRWEVILGRVVEARGGGEAAMEDRLGEERARMVEPGHARERSQTPQMPASNHSSSAL